jgi:hypothetical protein
MLAGGDEPIGNIGIGAVQRRLLIPAALGFD